MIERVKVGGVTYTVKEEDIEELVTRVSKVLCQVLRDNDFSWMREEESDE